jgi:hypothetical protein
MYNSEIFVVFCGSKKQFLGEFNSIGRHEKVSVATATQNPQRKIEETGVGKTGQRTPQIQIEILTEFRQTTDGNILKIEETGVGKTGQKTPQIQIEILTEFRQTTDGNILKILQCALLFGALAKLQELRQICQYAWNNSIPS